MLVAEPAAIADLGLLAQEHLELLDQILALARDDGTDEPVVAEMEREQATVGIEPRITTSSTPAPGSPSTWSWRSNSLVKNTETSAKAARLPSASAPPRYVPWLWALLQCSIRRGRPDTVSSKRATSPIA